MTRGMCTPLVHDAAVEGCSFNCSPSLAPNGCGPPRDRAPGAALEMEAAAVSDEAPLISDTNGSVKKKFRARKTMTASCRQQLATLKAKNGNKSEDAGKEPTNKNVTVQENAAAKINKNQGVFPNGLKVSIEVSQLDSGINIGCSYNETWDGISPKSDDVPFSHTTHFVVRDVIAATTENHVIGVDQVTSTTNAGGQVMSEDKLQIAESTMVQDVNAECEQANMDCSTITENLNASITVKIIEEEKSFKKTSSIDVVTPIAPLDTDSSAVPQNMLDPQNCTTDCSNACASPTPFSPVSDSVQPECDAAAGFSQKKRTCSESSDVPKGKRAKTSNRALLDEIQGLIDRRIKVLFEDLFAERMQSLSRQTDLVRKNGNRTTEVTKHLRSIRRLEKRIKHAVTLQKQVGKRLTQSPPVNSSSEEHNNNKEGAPTTSTVIPPVENMETAPRISPALNEASSSTELVVLSDNESEQPSSEQGKTDHAALHKIMESIKEHRKKANASRTVKAVKAVIDLTDDEGQRGDQDVEMVSVHPAPTTSSEETSSVENLFDKYSVQKDPASSKGREAAAGGDVNQEKQPVPKSPPPENLKESVVKQDAGPDILKPPQKTQLRIAQVQNPKGIALSWNISTVDPTCAPAKVYCLYVHQGDPSSPKKLWKKIGEIKALPLPMACTLTQFVEDTTYSFAMRAKDVDGRFGPLCDIQSTTLKPPGSSKKS
ncbi:activating transcription factor 7-interacting protein 2 isoform X2 [Engystomops pustulosus]|uniref:activating transcription factor 7-interacting protein 2 isoform X2 n=1 Tax=Engystomops pustulosus TaxID=76066 RepID=UPI003AFAC021